MKIYNHLVSRKLGYLPQLIPGKLEAKCVNCREPVLVDPEGCRLHELWGEYTCKPLCGKCVEETEIALSRR